MKAPIFAACGIFFTTSLLIGQPQNTQGTLELPIARLTLRVIDQGGEPIDGASVFMTFEEPTPAFGAGQAIPAKGLTNASGEFTGEGHSFDTKGGQAEKAGFYITQATPFKFEKSVEKKWQPWNPTVDVVLKKIINPIAMYARRVEVQLPVLDNPVGFDLEAADWVAPYGTGTNSDFIFELTKRVGSGDDYDAELVLAFSSKADGIQAMPPTGGGLSELRSPHRAPESDYEQSLALARGSSDQKGEYGTDVQNIDYFFRVRAKVDEDDNISNGLYGKIYGGIDYFPMQSQTAQIRFTYFLNPSPSDTNIEFDPRKNLFTNLKRMEKVNAR